MEHKPAGKPASKAISKPARKPVDKPTNKPTGKLARKSANQTANTPAHKSTNKSTAILPRTPARKSAPAEERLQKLLAARGIASRRHAEELIAAGKVKVNGRTAKLGDKAGPRDIVIVAGRRLAEADKPLYLMLHKPRGYVTTMSDERGRKCVADLVRDAGARVFPVGRLDTASEGLLLMTNDGDFANAVAHPAGHLPKTYRVTLRGTVKEEQLAPIAKGMALDGDKTAPADVRILAAEDTRTVAEIILYEGRNRQIRRMCEQLGLEVARLKRTAVGQLRLGLLPAGKWRALTEKEVRALQKEACFPNPERA